MTQEANTHDRYDLATNGENVKESVADIISNLSPSDTPLLSNIASEDSSQPFEEWLIDQLEDPSTTNAHIDGDQFAGDALVSPARLGNYHQISKKQLVVTRRADKVKKYGRKSELAYQLAKKGKELKRDVEATLHANQVAAAGSSSVAPTVAGLHAWIGVAVDSEKFTVSSRGAGLGADPALSGTNDGFVNTAAVAGTKRALSEATLLSIIKAVKLNGATPKAIHMHPDLKTQFSGYMFTNSSARIATQNQDHGKAKSPLTVVGSVDVWVTDFGVVEIVPNQFQDVDIKGAQADVSTVYVLDYEQLAVSWIDKYKVEDIAKVGDASRKHLIADYTLKVKNPAGAGIVADIEDDVAMAA